MNEEQRKAWEELSEAESGEEYPEFIRDVLVPRWVFRAADAELTRLSAIVARLEDVEGLAKIMCYTVCVNGGLELIYDVEAYWKICPKSVRENWIERARAVRDYAMKEG